MFNRKEFKNSAKLVIKKNYWSCLILVLIVTFLSGNASLMRFNIKSSGIDFSPWSLTGQAMDSLEVLFRGSDVALLLEGMRIGFNGWWDMLSLTKSFTNLFAPLFIIATIFMILHQIFKICVVNVLEVGKCKFFLQARNEEYEIRHLGFGFRQPSYFNAIKTLFLRDLYIFLLFFCFIVPGVIAIYRYRFIPYILADHPDLDSKEVFNLTRTMTDGLKMDMFLLDLSFLGWLLLDFITFGLASYFIAPYMEATWTEAYASLASDSTERTNNSYY